MKIALLLLLACVSLHAQVGTDPRRLTRRIEPQLRPQPPAARQGGAPAAVAGAAVPTKPLTAAEAESAKAKLTAEEQKKLQWQMERAEKGSDSAQFALGVRYLKGEGVPKDAEKAQKWLKEAAKNGNAEAKKKLAELEAEKLSGAKN